MAKLLKKKVNHFVLEEEEKVCRGHIRYVVKGREMKKEVEKR